tara:strand:- start:379 stop:639 length:261 start_codon:yes stop_codon:yes gene_type:complete
MKETDFAMWVTGIILGLTIGGMALLDFVKMMMEEIKPDELMDKEMLDLTEEQRVQKLALEGHEEEGGEGQEPKAEEAASPEEKKAA